MGAISALVYRNLYTSIDKVTIAWQMIWPFLWIFVASVSLSSLMDKAIQVGNTSVTYPAFVATGMLAFNAMNTSSTAGRILWNDREYGMFQQLLTMSISRSRYIVSNLVSIMLLGMMSSLAIAAIGFPMLIENLSLSFTGVSYAIFALVAGTIFFGSITIIISCITRNQEQFNVVINGIFYFFTFVGATFYPSYNVPPILQTIFYFNPLTYFMNLVRAGVFSQVTAQSNIEAIGVGVMTGCSFLIAVLLMKRVRID